MNIKQTLGKATSLLGRTPPEDTESEAEDPDVYHSKAIIINDVFPVCEIEWKHLHRHLRFKADVDSMPYDWIKSRIDFSAFPGPLDLLTLNPSLRVRKDKKTVLIPMTIIKHPTLEIYFLGVKKLSLAHLQRQFQFNLMTAPLINLMPFPIRVGSVLEFELPHIWVDILLPARIPARISHCRQRRQLTDHHVDTSRPTLREEP